MIDWRVVVLASDVEAVGKLVTDTGFFSDSEQLIAIELVEETLARGKDSGYEFVFADMPGSPGRLLGYTCYGPIPDTQSSFDLYWIAVCPGQQRQGTGAALLQETERLARQQHAGQMFVDTSGREQYQPTRHFYERMGYREEGRLTNFYAPGDDKVIYAKRL